jgi:spore coat protein CotF
MMNQTLGAHELMELHEVLTDTIDGINQFHLYAPHCQDKDLQTILQNQINFMMNEYNSMLTTMTNKTGTMNHMSTYRSPGQVNPTYGIQGGTPEKPNQSMNQMNDRDVASGMLGCAKSSATMRMRAALECSDPELRSMIVQGAKNCADQAYEVWNYMNQKGYYQVPTFSNQTAQQIMGHYAPSQNTGMNQGQNFQ